MPSASDFLESTQPSSPPIARGATKKEAKPPAKPVGAADGGGEAQEKIKEAPGTAPSASDFLSTVKKTIANPPTLSAQPFLENRQEREAARQGLLEEGVDITSGAGLLSRAELALTPPERKQVALDRIFGEGNYRQTDLGIVATVPSEDGFTKEVLIDEDRLTFSDIADATDEIVIAGTALAGTASLLATFPLLATGGVASLTMLAAVAAVSGQVGVSMTDLAFALKNGGIDFDKEEDVELVDAIAKRRTGAALVDFLLDVATAGGLRVAGALKRKIGAPFAKGLRDEPARSIKEAAQRRGIEGELTPGEVTGSETLVAAEAIQEKVPGSTGPIRAQKKAGEEAIGKLGAEIKEGAPGASDFGRAATDELRRQRQSRQDEIDSLLDEAGERIERDLKQKAVTAPRALSMSESGELTKRAVIREKVKFINKQGVLEDRAEMLILELPEKERAFAATSGIKSRFKELREEFPKQDVVETLDTGLLDEFGNPITRIREGKEVIPEFMPQEVRKFLSGADKLPDKMTVSELRKMRQVIDRAIDDASAFPGVGTGVLKAANVSITQAIRDAAENAPTPEVREALLSAFKHYRTNRPKFAARHVARATRNADQPGFIEGEDFLPRLLLRNRAEDAQRVIRVLGDDHLAVRTARRSVVEHMMQSSKNSLIATDAIDPKLLIRQVDKLDDATKKIVFGSKEAANAFLERTRDLAARHNVIPVDELRKTPSNADVFDLIESAYLKADQAKKDFEEGVLRRVLRGEVGAEIINPEDFTRFVMKGASIDELKRIFRMLPSGLQEQFRKRLAVEVMDRAARSQNDPETLITGFVNSEDASGGSKILKILLEDYGPDKATSRAKVEFVLGADLFAAMRDYGILSAAKKRAADSAAAAGGLVRGSIIANVMNLKGGNVLRIAKYRLVAMLYRLPAFQKWLKRVPELHKRGQVMAAFQVVLPQITRAITNEFGEESETARTFNRFFAGDRFRKAMIGTKKKELSGASIEFERQPTNLSTARAEAEKRYPFIKQFSNVQIAPSKVKNKGGMGEFVHPDDPTNPVPGSFTITIGEESKNLQGGVADTIIADMVHAAGQFSPEFKALKKELVANLSDEGIALAKRRYENDFKGKFSGSNFSSFENFLNNFWVEGIVQHLLLPENSEINKIREANPRAVKTLDRIKALFESEIEETP